MIATPEIEYDRDGTPCCQTGLNHEALIDLARKSGILEGIELGKAEIIKLMKAERVDYTQIAKYTGMSVDGIERI